MVKIKYFELFAGTGIGGIALDNQGWTNIGFSEYDKFAIQNYLANFPNRKNWGDITLINEKELPNFDILIGGSPCTDISIMKKDGEGLRGSASVLFYDYLRILNHKLPSYFIFENVRNLLKSNNGEDFKIVKDSLEENYNIKYQLMNTADYGIPQTRRRLYIIGQRKDLGNFDYEIPNPIKCEKVAQDLLESQVGDKYYLSDKMEKCVMSWGTRGWSAKPETDKKIARPLTATMAKMHRASADNYYHTEYHPIGKTNLRRLTPRECARLQGLDDTYKIVVSDTQAYKLMGNAMSLNVIEVIAKSLNDYIIKRRDVFVRKYNEKIKF